MSTARTDLPWDNRSLTRWPPMKPPAPPTTTSTALLTALPLEDPGVSVWDGIGRGSNWLSVTLATAQFNDRCHSADRFGRADDRYEDGDRGKQPHRRSRPASGSVEPALSHAGTSG